MAMITRLSHDTWQENSRLDRAIAEAELEATTRDYRDSRPTIKEILFTADGIGDKPMTDNDPSLEEEICTVEVFKTLIAPGSYIIIPAKLVSLTGAVKLKDEFQSGDTVRVIVQKVKLD